MGTIEQGLRPVETREENRGFTVTILPGREPMIAGLDRDASADTEPLKTSKAY